jgi:AraC-like DNA-binding protein
MMMRNSSLRMIDIAEACGFGSQAHFSRVFRRIYGVTRGSIAINSHSSVGRKMGVSKEIPAQSRASTVIN